MALGIRKATTTIIQFPAIVLTPAFTFWTFGPISSTSCCIYKKNEPMIYLSYRFTWINALLTSCITVGLLAYAWFYDYYRVMYEPEYYYSACALVSLIWNQLSLITLAMIQCLGKCPCISKDKHLPMKPKVIYHTEKMEKC